MATLELTGFARELDVYLRARSPLIIVVTSEEQRLMTMLKDYCEKVRLPCLTWEEPEGFRYLWPEKTEAPQARDSLSALEVPEKIEGQMLIVLKDFHDAWGNFKIRRKLRSVAQRLRSTSKTLLITTPVNKLPDELKDEAVIVTLPPPTAAELVTVLDQFTNAPNVRVNLTRLGREKLVQAALGLSISQAQRVFSKAIVSNKILDDDSIALVTSEKKQIIRESESLVFYSVTETVDDVGGLGVLKEWLRLREQAFTQHAREYGLPAPKGIALIGIPGTGKSLTAKMIGGLWRLPLLRLDAGSLFGSLMGESEERARRALRVAETVAPCILWIDEIEKSLSHGGHDSGTSTRVFGTILTWMQEKTAPCFVVATANDISSLPPELLRKGRFDEIFFLDLPTQAERQEIFTVHLRKRRRISRDFDVSRLARESEGYVGAEIEQAIIDAMYVGFNDDREFTTADISNALTHQVPLSVSQREIISGLRNWLREGRAQSASFRETTEAERQFVPVQLDVR